MNFRFELRLLLFLLMMPYGIVTTVMGQVNTDSNSTKKPSHHRIDKIVIEGNKRTKHSIIRRELRFREGDSLHTNLKDSLLRAERNKVFNTNLFVTVFVTLEHNDTTGINTLRVKVKERWYTFPQLIFDLADRNFNEWIQQRGASLARVNYGIRFYQNNCRGRNETLRLTLQDGFTRLYDFSYSIPYLNKRQKLGLRIGGSYSNNKQVAYATENHKLQYFPADLSDADLVLRDNWKFGVALNYRNKFFATHTLELNYNHNHINDTIEQLNPAYFLNGQTTQKYLSLKYTFNNDRRDVRQYAHKGFLFKFDIERIGFMAWENVDLTRATLTYARYGKLAKNLFWGSRAKTKISAPILQPWTLFQGLGYDQDYVRGYELYPIDGQDYFLLRNSVRYRFYSKIHNAGKTMPVNQFRVFPIDLYISFFADAGYVSRTNPQTFDNTRFSNTALGSVGTGINIVSFYDTVFRFEYSYNLAGDIHFAFSFAGDI